VTGSGSGADGGGPSSSWADSRRGRALRPAADRYDRRRARARQSSRGRDRGGLFLDLAINISFNPTRSVIADVTPDGNPRTKGYTWMQTISGFFGVLAYVIGAVAGNMVLIHVGVVVVFLCSVVPILFVSEPREFRGPAAAKGGTTRWGQLFKIYGAMPSRGSACRRCSSTSSPSFSRNSICRGPCRSRCGGRDRHRGLVRGPEHRGIRPPGAGPGTARGTVRARAVHTAAVAIMALGYAGSCSSEQPPWPSTR